MSNFILVTSLERGAENCPVRVNAEKIVILEPETDGTMIFTERHILRVAEDVNTILFRITQGEKR